MAKVIWERQALDDLDQIIGYIMDHNAAAAVRIGSCLVDLGESLALFPQRGRPTAAGRREMTTVPPYVLAYVAAGDTVSILSIRHGARRPIEE